ncbi:uncharacterized protein LOC131950625 [Physella acuta]|uniref:uncharacterized protein LOC131950625 n=1 Tax=Physella acuta TaxID=109671 RepID=UPI0027DB0D1C|nr:uncharacterized protein LOC131950625 [Physella acuta]XP_059168812.1 uncharacterized protein LOC131950625 [Physella acuta]
MLHGSEQLGQRGHLITQFKTWILDWSYNVFQDKLPCPKNLCFFYSQSQHLLINELVSEYHKNNKNQVGQDRFVWAMFAKALIKEHKLQSTCNEYHSKYQIKCRQIHKCLYILLAVSYYLQLRCTELVKEILREIISCTKNLRFMFSFLPSMSVNLYASLLWVHSPLYEEQLCREYFFLIDAETAALNNQYTDVFKSSQPYLYYLVKHLTPLHSAPNSLPVKLHEILSKPLLKNRKYSLLTLAVQYHNVEIIKCLLEIGAQAQHKYYDQCTEAYVCAESLLANSVNSIMGARQFLISININYKELTKKMDTLINEASSYVHLMRRSVFCSRLKKVSDMWCSEDSTYELNRVIADEWGIEHKVTFPTLQHICKIQIRRAILNADKELIPIAVKLLPVPNKLKQYLNLELD